MTFSKPLILLLLAGGISCASTLAVYQDNTFYNFSPKDHYIGFTSSSTAKCDGSSIALETMSTCLEDDRLCKMLITLKDTTLKLDVVQSNIKMLNRLITLPKPTTFDASSWISAAKLLAEEQVNLSSKETVLNKEVNRQRKTFREQAPTQDASQSMETCNSDIELTLPYGHVSFSANYEADIEDDKEVTVTQYLNIVNRSGVDIEADTAMFYYRSAQQYVNPVHFNPWIVSKYVPRPKRVYKKSMLKRENVEMTMMAEEMAGDILPMVKSVPMASYEDAREYKIQNLTLLSTGMPVEVEVITWKAPLSCEVRVYPYVNTNAFNVCTFEPKYQIDTNSWKIKSKKEVINENAAGEYRDGKYNLYIKVDEDIQIQRRPIVQKERETGILGGTARKKDGFTLTITNKSDKNKTLTLIDRIPTSTTEEIKVKLLSINAKKKVNYKMLKDGQIEMKIELLKNETKNIEVLFEIAYDKDLKVNY